MGCSMRMRVFSLSILSLFMLSIFSISFPLPTKAAASDSDFEWGVCGHSSDRQAYPQSTIEQQIHLAAELGAKLYRVDILSTSVGLNNFENVLQLTKAYGMDVMAVIYGGGDNPSTTESIARAVSKRFAGRVKYYQLNNEVDNATIKQDGGDGRSVSDYDKAKLDSSISAYKALSKGIREGDPNAKICINMTWWHTGLLDYITQQNVDYDLIGLDWYSNMHSIAPILGTLCETYKSKDIIVTENNLWVHTQSQDEMAGYLSDTINDIKSFNSDRLKGYVVYELLDESNISGGEGRFGLVNCSKDSTIGAPKDAYYTVQSLFGGGSKAMVTLSKNTNPTPAGKTTSAPVSSSSSNGNPASSGKSAAVSSSSAQLSAESTGSDSDITASDTCSSDDSSLPDNVTVTSPADQITGTPVQKSHPWIIVTVIILVIAAGAGTGIVLYLKHKKNNPSTPGDKL